MQSIGIPDDILTKINRQLFALVWKKRNITTTTTTKKASEKVKRKILTQDIKRGLKMIDMKTLQEALYLTWIPKLVNKREEQNSRMAHPSTVSSKLALI